MVTPFAKGSLMKAETTDITIDDLAYGGKILVLAPHPDDEALGCGGAIAAASDAGYEVYIVCISDGSMSHQSSNKWPRERLIELRAQEFFRSTHLLTGGKGHSYMLGYQDQNTPQTAAEIELACLYLRQLIDPFKPTTIWASWIGDPHIDHKNTARLAYALQRHFTNPKLLFYSVWGRFIDISDKQKLSPYTFQSDAFLTLKNKAVMAHRSQMTGLINDDPEGFVMAEETREHLINTPEYFLEIDDEYRSL